MRKSKGKKTKISYFILISMLVVQMLGVSNLYAATSKMTNAIHKAYSNKLKSIGNGLKSAIYADLDQDGIEELVVGLYNSSASRFCLQVYKYKNNSVNVIDQIIVDGMGTMIAGMNNFSIVKSKNGKDVAIKQEFREMGSGCGTWITTHYKFKNSTLSAYAIREEFSNDGDSTRRSIINVVSYQINGKTASETSYTNAVKKYTVESKIVDTGYGQVGLDSDECKDYTNRGSAIHKSVKEDIKLVINGETLKLDTAAPVQINGSTLVPIRVVSQYLGAEISWKSPVVTVTKDDKVMELTLNSKTALVNNQKVALDVAPTVIDGVTMIPLRFVADNLSATTKWDKNTQTVTITANDTTSNTQTSKEEVTSSDHATNIALLSQGKIDTLPYKTGTQMSVVIQDLGEGEVETYQGIYLHEYGNYSLSESMQSPILMGGFFYEGYTMYGFTIGKDNAEKVKMQLGTPEHVSNMEEGEFSTMDYSYCYIYIKNNCELYVYFNEKDIIERVDFIDKNQI